MASSESELVESLKRIRDADQLADYHTQRALEWTRRAWRLREEFRNRNG